MGKTKSTQEALQGEISKMEDLLKKKEMAINNPKVLAAINKQLEQIKKHSYGKRRQRASTTRNSGLEKIMPITQKMADFAGWDVKTPKSRVDITRFLCGYIKDHNLQNQDNKKEIVLDHKLADLLKYHERTITYPHIQKYIHLLFDDSEEPQEITKEVAPEEPQEIAKEVAPEEPQEVVVVNKPKPRQRKTKVAK